MLKALLRALTEEQLTLLIDCVMDYESTNVLADDSEIRRLAVWIGINNAIGYLVICYNILLEHARRQR